MRSHHLLLLLSGVCGLGYQVVWTRWFGLGLGHEMAGVIGVVGAFFLGLAVGAWALDRPIARSSRPGLWYVGLEVLIGVWALACAGLIPMVDELAASLLGARPTPLVHGLLATLIPAVVLLPATVAMGATLPAMERFAAAGRRVRIVGGLYSANTAGAVVGTLAITFAVLPHLGFRTTTLVLAGLNFACAAAAWAMGAGRRFTAEVDAPEPEAPGKSVEVSSSSVSARRLHVTLFATGFLGIAFETLGIRMLNQFLENTVFTFAVVLSVYLGGTALGAALYQRWLSSRSVDDLLGPLMASLALACLIGTCSLEFVSGLRIASGEGGGLLTAVGLEALLALFVFLVPTVLMGAAFSCLAQALRKAHGGLGRALAINTLGSALGPSLAGLVIAPTLGLRLGMVVIVAGYGALAIGRVRSVAWPLVGALAGALLATSDLGLVEVGPGETVIARRDGAMASVTVTENPGGVRTLRVDNRFRMGGTQSSFLERRQGMIPLLLHPSPERALFLGLGSGTTLSAVTFFGDLEADGVELLPEVLEVLPLFSATNEAVTEHPRIRLAAADARRFVRAASAEYDVVIADLFQPARDGAGALYQVDSEVAAMIVRSFLAAFPSCDAYLASFNVQTPALGLVGYVGEASPGRLDLAELEARFARTGLGEELTRLALDDVFDLAGSRVADAEQLRELAGEGPLNTDDLPLVTFAAPRQVYGERTPGWTALEPFLAQPPASAQGLIGSGEDTTARRIEAYALARDAFLRGQIALAEERLGDALDNYVASTAASQDFQAGYVQAISLANTATSVPRTLRLAAVEELARLRPDRGDLRALRRQLSR